MDVDIDIAGENNDKPPLCPTNPPDGSAKSQREWDLYTKRSVAYERQKQKKQAAMDAEARNSRAVQEFSRMQLRQRVSEREEREGEEMVFIDEETKPIPPKVCNFIWLLHCTNVSL